MAWRAASINGPMLPVASSAIANCPFALPVSLPIMALALNAGAPLVVTGPDREPDTMPEPGGFPSVEFGMQHPNGSAARSRPARA